MTWGVTMDVPEPVELYDAVHQALLERTAGVVDGLLVHLARQTEDGFQVVEVWESGEDFERASAEIVGPVAAGVQQGRPRHPTVVTPFDVRGLVLPRAGIAVRPSGARGPFVSSARGCRAAARHRRPSPPRRPATR